jgi:exopolysaccharide production protein ExoY
MPTMLKRGFTNLDNKDVLTNPVATLTSAQTTSANMALGGWLKLSFDVMAALCALIILSPLFVLTALAVKLSSPGPVLFGHTRVGYGGRTFKCWKFRSMVTNGDEVLEKYLAAHPDERDEWISNRKLRNDPRVTRIGAVLRTYSVDELPQVINVLMGEMSLVGPRPVVWDELAMYGPAASIYLQTRPGITGLWQVSGRSDASYDQRVSFDTNYVQNWSLVQDLSIIARTIPAVLSAKGSY